MKKLYINTIFAIVIVTGLNIQVLAQKDTTELEIGKKKLIIIDKKTQKENGIYNLEKGKETFKKEIIIADKIIEEHKDILKKIETELENAFKNFEGDSGITKNIHIEYNIDEIDDAKIDSISKEIENQIGKGNLKNDVEIIILGENEVLLDEKTEQMLKKLLDEADFEKLKVELEKHRAFIDLNTKKKYAFESGIEEIEKGIEEIEKSLEDIDEELEKTSGENRKIGKKRNIKKKKFNAHWAGLEFGLLNFLNNAQVLASNDEMGFVAIIPERTFNYSLNMFEYNIPITKYHFGIATGAGIHWNSLNLAQNVKLVEGDDGVMYAELINTDDIEIKKNKLNAAYISIPVLFEYQTPIKNKKLYFNAGVFGSIRAWSKQKQIYHINGRKYKDKQVDDFQLSAFRYGLTAGAGYGDFGVFIEYSMVPFFKEGKGPEMYPIMVGVRLLDF